jgi:penicillin-binding protein 1A
MKRRLVLILIIVVTTVSCVSLSYAANLSKNMRKKLENIRLASVVYDNNGRVIGNLYFYKRIWLPDSKVAPVLKDAIVAIEDSRFYHHKGIDLRGMMRALVQNIKPGGNMQGGSTITQQLAKIALLSHERTISRKIQDITYALEIERSYTKREILELYINSVYLAHGNVGVEAAARFYFGKSAEKLNLEEAALIAGMIRSPENYSPFKNPKAAKDRRDVVLGRMLDLKYITSAQHRRAVAQPLKLAEKSESASVAGYFLDYLRNDLLSKGFTEEQLRFGGYRIYSTLDLGMQQAAEKTMLELPHDLPAKVQPQGALLTLDPNTGQIRAMVGGRSYVESQYNRSVMSHRQPGSTIKPFIFATALEKGYTAATIMEDKPLEVYLPNGTIWSPENYDRNYRGRIALREALKHSVNSIAVQLVQEIGIDEVVKQMEKLGLTNLVKSGANNDLNLAPLSLGGLTKGVTPLELAASYAAFPNGGEVVKPYGVIKVTDRDGKLIKQFAPVKKRGISPQTAYIMTMLMTDVIDGGTGLRAKLPDRVAAGKTGTTSDYTNAWFVGYTPELLSVVWIGNDRQEQSMAYKNRTIGSGTAAELWSSYMKQATASLPPHKFIEPTGVVWANVDRETGKAIPGWISGNHYKEVFAEDNVPASTSYKIWRWMVGGKKQESEQSQEKSRGWEESSTFGEVKGTEEQMDDHFLGVDQQAY